MDIEIENCIVIVTFYFIFTDSITQQSQYQEKCLNNVSIQNYSILLTIFHESHTTYNKIRRCTHILSMPRQGLKNVLFKVPQPHNPLQCLHFGPTTLKNKISLLISRKKCTFIIWLSFHENSFARCSKWIGKLFAPSESIPQLRWEL